MAYCSALCSTASWSPWPPARSISWDSHTPARPFPGGLGGGVQSTSVWVEHKRLRSEIAECYVHPPYTTSLWASHIQRPHSQANAKHMDLMSHQHPLSIQASCPDLIWGKMITMAITLFLLQARKPRREWVNSSSEDREEEANRNPRDSHQSFCHGIGPGTRPAEHEGPSIWLREEMALNG